MVGWDIAIPNLRRHWLASRGRGWIPQLRFKNKENPPITSCSGYSCAALDSLSSCVPWAVRPFGAGEGDITDLPGCHLHTAQQSAVPSLVPAKYLAGLCSAMLSLTPTDLQPHLMPSSFYPQNPKGCFELVNQVGCFLLIPALPSLSLPLPLSTQLLRNSRQPGSL